MNRFYAHAGPVETPEGHGIALDGRPLKTPARHTLTVPTEALARAIAREWAEQGEEIRPDAMRLTGLANAAIDIIAPDRASFAATIGAYAESDLLCYRAEETALAAEQAKYWNSLLDWAERRFGIEFRLTTGVMHVAQPEATVAALRAAVAELDHWRLAALSPLATISGSLVTALAVVEGGITADAGWDAATLDERWQAERWGEDAEATAALARRRAEWDAAADLLRTLTMD